MISGESSEPGIDLLVTSTHGRTGFERALLGSVAEHVVRYTECPVITVPSRDQPWLRRRKVKARRVATRMAMLHRGKFVAEGTPAEMRASRNSFLVQFLSGSTEGPILGRSKYHMLSPPE